MIDKIAVIGAGSWGTAAANLLAKKGYEVKVWDRQTEVCDGINSNRLNPLYLKDISLAPMFASTDMDDVLAGTQVMVCAIPSAYVSGVIPAIKNAINGQLIVSLSKGLEVGSNLRVSEILHEGLSGKYKSISILSGPNHAEEVSLEIPSATVISSKVEEDAKKLQELFMTSYFRVYTNDDITGVEIGGAVKNVIAIAAGISDGLGYGDNTKASLMTRGLAEMKRFGVALGANRDTFSGLSGVGDLIATCTSRHSRNRRIGELIGKGVSLQDAEKELGMVAEGVKTSIAVSKLAIEKSVEMPICNSVAAVLHQGHSPKEEVRNLMSRGATSENL